MGRLMGQLKPHLVGRCVLNFDGSDLHAVMHSVCLTAAAVQICAVLEWWKVYEEAALSDTV